MKILWDFFAFILLLAALVPASANSKIICEPYFNYTAVACHDGIHLSSEIRTFAQRGITVL